MSSSVVRPGYGPSLPQVLKAQPRAVQLLARLIGVLILLAVAWWVLFGRASDLTRVIIGDPIAFNVGYKAPLQRVEPKQGELLRLEGPAEEFVVKPLRLPPYEGQFSGFLPAYSSTLAAQMERERPGLVVRGEGRVNINKVRGYELIYQAPGEDGRKRYGRRIMMLPDDTAREGVEILLETDASAAVPTPDDAGRVGPTKSALRSFRFGTDPP
jgi:hypothetical protein